jgi:hypothetical protein
LYVQVGCVVQCNLCVFIQLLDLHNSSRSGHD